jgi:hypothetical protein
MADGGEEEDDYLSMSFVDTKAKETSLQRTARLRREAAERGRQPSKKEREEQAKAAREAALSTQLDASNKGAQMMAKMGFKGGALGKTEGARTQPIDLLMKDDRGGLGMDSEKKRKIREAAAGLRGVEKRRKVDENEYRERNRIEREEKRAQGQMWSAMRTLESFETGAVGGQEEDTAKEDGDGKDAAEMAEAAERKPLRSINVLWRTLPKRRLEGERARRMRYDLQQSLAQKEDYADPNADAEKKPALGLEVEGLVVEELDEEDPELEEFEALGTAEKLGKIVAELREKYHYCFWCKYRYEDEGMEGCPGLTEDEHG